MKKGKEIIKRVLTIGICLFLVNLVLVQLSKVTENKTSEGNLRGFFEEDKEIDVLFFGSSHVRHGFFSMELWRDYGMVSYNLACNGDTIPIAYWKLVMALEYQKPKLVVMDIYDIWPVAKTSRLAMEGMGQVHGSIDAFPLTKNKVKAVLDLFEDEEQ